MILFKKDQILELNTLESVKIVIFAENSKRGKGCTIFKLQGGLTQGGGLHFEEGLL